MKTPKFWYVAESFGDWLLAVILIPVSLIYYAVSKELRKGKKPYKAPIPVICVGNLVAGGAGKTPSTIAITKWFKDKGYNPHIISRGYGGTNIDELKVDVEKHDSRLVGDEPFMMAKMGLDVWVAPKRAKLAYLAAKKGADLVIMDDGFQNFDLVKTFSFIVVDGLVGFGNRNLIPAGPLRERIQDGVKRADACIFIDDDLTGSLGDVSSLPTITGEFIPLSTELEGKDVYPFAGMGRPEKFLRTLFKMGANIVGYDDFPDHYYYQNIDIATLLKNAKRKEAIPVTTRKDFTRIPEEYKKYIKVVDVELNLDLNELDDLMAPIIAQIEENRKKVQAKDSTTTPTSQSKPSKKASAPQKQEKNTEEKNA